MTLAEHLKEWRTSRRLSQPDAAVMLGVPARTLQGWEAGRAPAHPGLILKLLDLLRTDVKPDPSTRL